MEAVLSEELRDEPDLRRIVKVTVRTSHAGDQLYLEPEVSLEGWITSLAADVVNDPQIMALYSDHTISKPLHSELKTDLDPERLHSGKLNTNSLVMAFATTGGEPAAADGAETHRPGCASASPGQTSSPEDGDAEVDDYGRHLGLTKFWCRLALPVPIQKHARRQQKSRRDKRCAHLKEIHIEQRTNWRKQEQEDCTLSAKAVAAALRELIGEQAVIVDEAVTSSGALRMHLPRDRPATLCRSVTAAAS